MALNPFAGTLALALSIGCAALPVQAVAATAAAQPGVNAQIKTMQDQIKNLQQQLETLKKQQAASATTTHVKSTPPAKQPATTASGWDIGSPLARQTGIAVGGAVRFQYTTGSYNHDISHRKGDIQFDTFRLDLRGKVHGIILDAQWRWYSYMQTLQHAWVGYDFNKRNEGQIGLVRIPFGNQPYNSHSYFFSSAYYLGLEDTMAMGGEYVYQGDQWNVQAAFLKDDAATAASGLDEGYSYVVLGIRQPGQGINDAPVPGAGARAVNSGALRVARMFRPDSDLSIEVGGSALYGMLGHGGPNDNKYVGRYGAYALHTNINYKRWNFQAEAIHYAYRTDDHARKMIVGAYAFNDTIAARADVFTLNGAYTLPVSWGPIESLTFYNDNSLVTNKSGHLANTFMIVTGVAVGAGDLYTYFDFINAKNQPFIGGSMGGDEHGVDNRFNINVGYYF